MPHSYSDKACSCTQGHNWTAKTASIFRKSGSLLGSTTPTPRITIPWLQSEVPVTEAGRGHRHMTLVSHFRKISQRVSAGISYRLTSRLRSQCQLHMRNGLSPVPAPQLPVKGWTTIHATVHQDRNASQSVRSPRIRSSQLCLHSAVTTRWEGIRQETTRFRASGGMRAYAAVGGDPKHYETLAEQHYAELEVKKSKFLATAWPISSPEEVREEGGLIPSSRAILKVMSRKFMG